MGREELVRKLRETCPGDEVWNLALRGELLDCWGPLGLADLHIAGHWLRRPYAPPPVRELGLELGRWITQERTEAECVARLAQLPDDIQEARWASVE